MRAIEKMAALSGRDPVVTFSVVNESRREKNAFLMMMGNCSVEGASKTILGEEQKNEEMSI